MDSLYINAFSTIIRVYFVYSPQVLVERYMACSDLHNKTCLISGEFVEMFSEVIEGKVVVNL